MDEMRKKPGLGGQGKLRRRLMMPAMTWDGAAFLVLITVRIDGCVCNTLLIFIDPPSPYPFSSYSDVTVDVTIPCYPARDFSKDSITAAAGEASGKGTAVGAAAKESPPPTAYLRNPPDRNNHNIFKAVRESEMAEAFI